MTYLRYAIPVVLAFLVGCTSSPRVTTDYQAGYNFSTLKNFSVSEARQETKDELLISPFTFSHIQQVIEQNLEQRYQAVAAGQEDFIVNFHIVIEEKLDPGTYDRVYGYGYYGRGYRYYPAPLFYGTTGAPRVYNQGSLIIDLIDAKTEKPFWRGVSEKRLRQGQSPQEQREVLTGAVLEVLSHFPPL